MKELKAYLVRSVCDWALDQGLTPHVAVHAAYPGASVPRQFVKEDRIVLNIHPNAIADYVLGDEGLVFSARFEGRPFPVAVPLPAILAVYARENGQGISFPEPAPPGPDDANPPPQPPAGPTGKGARLRVVK